MAHPCFKLFVAFVVCEEGYNAHLLDRDNPYTNEIGLVADRDMLWDALMKELNEGGEFDVQPASQWSAESDSASESPSTGTMALTQEDLTSPTQSGSDMAQIPLSQPASQKPSSTFKEMGARKRASPGKRDKQDMRTNLLLSQHTQRASQAQPQRQQHNGYANNAVSEMVASQRPRTQASGMMMSSMASSAAKYVSLALCPRTSGTEVSAVQSQFHAIAPSQVADPNLARWYSLWDVGDIYKAIVSALQDLQVTHIDEDFPRGAAIRIQVRDKHNEFIQGTIYIQYEPTDEDYASLAPDADFSDILRQREEVRKQMINDGEEMTVTGQLLEPPSGIGMGGYVVKTLWSGNPGERKRLFKEIQARMPQGLVYAK